MTTFPSLYIPKEPSFHGSSGTAAFEQLFVPGTNWLVEDEAALLALAKLGCLAFFGTVLGNRWPCFESDITRKTPRDPEITIQVASPEAFIELPTAGRGFALVPS